MASLDDLKKRIASVKSTQKITKAMKMVAAAKLRRAQESAEKGRPYSEKMNNIILNLSSGISDKENAPKLLSGSGNNKVHLCVVMTSDRGLCGGFNSNIIKKAKSFFAKLTEDGKDLKIITVGSKGNDKVQLCVVMTSDRGLCGGFNSNIIKKSKSYFTKLAEDGKDLKIITVGSKGNDQLKRTYGDKIIANISFKESKHANFFDAEKVGKMVIEKFGAEEFDVCTIFYNQFKNVITQIPQAQQIIPLNVENSEKDKPEDNYEFEPDEDEILSNLLPKNISTQIFKAMLENSASEQGSRMSAMDNATRNAGEMVDKLTIEYNRSRQATITEELIELISGAERL